MPAAIQPEVTQIRQNDLGHIAEGYEWLITGTSRALNLERRLEHDDHPAALQSSGGVTPPVFLPNGISNPWGQRETSANGEYLSHFNNAFFIFEWISIHE